MYDSFEFFFMNQMHQLATYGAHKRGDIELYPTPRTPLGYAT